MNKLFTLLFILFSIRLMAQTGIGTTTPDASAKLEVASSNKGFLPPRVSLTATNSASPITNPANGLMVFNTVTAGANPFQVVPGYYYWDGTGQKWVSLSTTVGNVQNQGVFRSTSNTAALTAITTWSSSFNNIASGDLTIGSNTTFTLSNGFFKLEWALPYQSAGDSYNAIQLQENVSGSTWTSFKNNNAYSQLGNGGGTQWGGGTYAADVVDCSTSTRRFRIINSDGFRELFAGATFIITKLNPSITTSTTADNLGNHIATNNIQLNGNYLSNDGGNEGIRIDNNGNVGIGTNAPAVPLEVNGTVQANNLILSNTNSASPSLSLKNGDAAAAFSDNSQLRMGWSGSPAGTSQYAQIIHTRHNSGATSNAIDFYLSNGTANNTITSGSTRAMTITSPGDVEITGKLNIGDAGGNVATKVAGFVAAGTFISLDNIKATVTTSDNRGLSIGAVSTTFEADVSGYYTRPGAVGGSTSNNQTYTTTASGSYGNWHFPTHGDMVQLNLRDKTNNRFYRITMMIGASYISNFISIERLF